MWTLGIYAGHKLGKYKSYVLKCLANIVNGTDKRIFIIAAVDAQDLRVGDM